MVNIFKKGLFYLAKKLQKYVPLEDDNHTKKETKNKKEITNIDEKKIINKDKEPDLISDIDNVNINTKNILENTLKENNNLTYNINKNNYNNQQQEQTKEILKHEYETKQEPKIYTVEKLQNKINTIWDILKIKENTQAEHLIKVIPSDQWIDMEEIKQRIKLEYNIEYKNEKSLYPYLKTLTDINLIKLNNTGKKRSWKKNIIIIE